MSMPALNRFESQVGKMLMVHQSPKEPLGNFSHVLLDGRNFEGKQETSLFFTEQATSTLWQKRDGINTYIDHEGEEFTASMKERYPPCQVRMPSTLTTIRGMHSPPAA